MIEFIDRRPTTDEVRNCVSEELGGVRHHIPENAIELIEYEGDEDEAITELNESAYDTVKD